MSEMIDVVDQDNNVVRQEPRSMIRKNALLHRSSEIIVTNTKKEYFVQKRAADKDLWPNMYEIGVGETVLAGETYEAAAERGIAEEIGVNMKPRFLFSLKIRLENNNENMRVYDCVVDKELIFADKEVSEGFFVSEDKLRKILNELQFVPPSRIIIKKYWEFKNDRKEN